MSRFEHPLGSGRWIREPKTDDVGKLMEAAYEDSPHPPPLFEDALNLMESYIEDEVDDAEVKKAVAIIRERLFAEAPQEAT